MAEHEPPQAHDQDRLVIGPDDNRTRQEVLDGVKPPADRPAPSELPFDLRRVDL